MSKEKSIDEQLKELEEIVELLETGEAPVEELMKKYEQGMELARQCREFLEKAEQKIIEIKEKNSLENNKNDDINDVE
jgi:exodeoxyribonuclease VII small subunit